MNHISTGISVHFPFHFPCVCPLCIHPTVFVCLFVCLFVIDHVPSHRTWRWMPGSCRRSWMQLCEKVSHMTETHQSGWSTYTTHYIIIRLFITIIPAGVSHSRVLVEGSAQIDWLWARENTHSYKQMAQDKISVCFSWFFFQCTSVRYFYLFYGVWTESCNVTIISTWSGRNSTMNL